MARPSKFDRDEAIETAMEAFWRAGYQACSVRALSERLGITRSSFYNAFGSREALFREALARYGDQAPDQAFADAQVNPGEVRRRITEHSAPPAAPVPRIPMPGGVSRSKAWPSCAAATKSSARS